MAKEKLSAEAQEMEDYFARREQRNAPPWMPAQGTVLLGTVIGLHMRESGFGLYPVIVYKTDGGQVFAVHAFHTVLRERLKELATDLGKRQFITYLGKRRKNNATEQEIKENKADYHHYDAENADEANTVEGVSEDFKF